MKKFILLICSSIFATTCFSQSLNGYTQADALQMIAPFQKQNTQPPQITSVWFDKRTVLKIDSLLNAEVSKKRTDGIRIYFAYDNSHQETIVIVSTKDSGIHNNQSPEKDNFHDDYYDHSISIPLSGEVCHDLSCNGGALLYKTSGDNDTCIYTASNSHYLTRTECENMAQGFASQKENINTKGEWFDLKLVDAFADDIENNPNIDGIRIYFARHPSNDRTGYEDEDAFVIVPTYTIANSNPAINKQDYFDCFLSKDYFSKADVRFRKIKSHVKKGKSKFKLFNFKFKAYDSGGGQDNGELCPYNCNI
jgi:hypothetical protein